MMPRGRQTSVTIRLTPEERRTLTAWQRSPTISAGRARRGRIILQLADGIPIVHIAKTVGSADALSINGPGAFSTMVLMVWRTDQAAAAAMPQRSCSTQSSSTPPVPSPHMTVKMRRLLWTVGLPSASDTENWPGSQHLNQKRPCCIDTCGARTHKRAMKNGTVASAYSRNESKTHPQ
jgi:hypothetical protein